MAHGGYGRRRVDEPSSSKGLGVDKRWKKNPKPVSLKNQIRSTKRLLQKDLPEEVRNAQKKKLEDLTRQRNGLALGKKNVEKCKKQRKKVERKIRQMEKKQRASSDSVPDAKSADELLQLRQDLEYIKFFPKSEKYVSVLLGDDDPSTVAKRNKLRDQIKANIVAAAASGKDVKETTSDDDVDIGGDDFFISSSSSEEVEADDECTDKSAREQASSALGKASSGVSSDEKNHQMQRYVRVLMPFPQSLPPDRNQSQEKVERPSSSNASNRGNGPFNKNLSYQNTWKDHRSNLSTSSDAYKPRRKRRPKKKKQV